jgi:ubiquinone/menaquinone biosynthesis C-methylase UbiE
MKKQPVWESKKYYKVAKIAMEGQAHPGMKEIKKFIRGKKRVLEVGCGEGSKLQWLCAGNEEVVGVDISETAIKLAKSQHPELTFIQADAGELPFTDNYFNVAYSAFVLEHLTEPEKVVEEMIRVVRSRGLIAIIAPNFGAPQRCSPCFKGNRYQKLLTGFLKDTFCLFNKAYSAKIRWKNLEPLSVVSGYEIDKDTTVEPYLRDLVDFLRVKKLEIITYSSFWDISEHSESGWNKAFRFLGKLGLYPYKYWGPHLLVVARK